jgi:hypothetical protein
MNIIEINSKSKMKDLYNKVSGVDKDYFLHRIDENLPPHSFKRFDMKPDLIKTVYGEGKTEFTIPKKGFLAKMFIKHKIIYPTSDNAIDTSGSISDRIGAFMFKKLELTQYGNSIETLNEAGILERVNTSLFNNIKNIHEAIEADQLGNTLTFYTPVLFSLNSDINHFLDMKHIQELKLTLENDTYESLGLNEWAEPDRHEMTLMIDFMSIKNYEEYAKTSFSKPQMVAIENCVLETGKVLDLKGGFNTIRLRSRDLVKKIIIRAVSTLPGRNSIEVNDIKLESENETIYEAFSTLESLLFSKNYQGLASHKIPDATDDGIAEIQFEIPNFRNSNSGCLNLDEIHKDCKLTFKLFTDARVFINYMVYEMLIVKPDGIIVKADPNNSAFLDDYKYSDEPTKPEPVIEEVKDGKDIDKNV